MDFFLYQERSRTKTLYLIAMFMAAVALVVFCVYFAVQMGFFVRPEQRLLPRFYWFDLQRFLLVALITLTVIIVASVIRIVQLSKGGGYVAESLGGELLNKVYADRKKKILLNVVEEMAIAAGVPVPQVYLLDKEMGINAFAAGYIFSDAAIAVTHGCMEQLNRDELQGVIAHEYSHILNGDMRLNIRLMGFLYGIMAIGKIGRDSIRGWSRSKGGKSGAQAVLVAMLLIGIGYIGMLLGQMIQAAVSRQREFLADASAVQFTRNPGGIANALKKIGRFSESSRIDSPEALEISHMFFSLAVQSLFSTHPPLDERIRRLEPEFRGKVNEFGRLEPVRGLKAFSEGAFDSTINRIAVNPQEAKSVVGKLTPEHINYSSELISALPQRVRKDLDDMLGALGIVCALLLDKDPGERNNQIKALKSISSHKIVDQVLAAEGEIKKIAPVFHFPILELAIPTLRQMSPDQYFAFSWFIRTLVEADGKLTIFEFVIQKIVTHHLDAYYNHRKRQPIIKNINVLALHTADFLSILAKAGQREAQDSRKAFDAGFARLTSAGAAKKEVYSEKVTLKHADAALDLLARAAPGIKRTIFDACCETVLFDQKVTIKEAEILRMAASIMDMSVPPFLSRKGSPGDTIP